MPLRPYNTHGLRSFGGGGRTSYVDDIGVKDPSESQVTQMLPPGILKQIAAANRQIDPSAQGPQGPQATVKGTPDSSQSQSSGGYYRGGMPHFGIGGAPEMSAMAPWYARKESSGMDQFHGGGLFNSPSAGRTDVLNRTVPAGAYVVPADVVSGIGEGNTMAGSHVLDAMMHSLPYGMRGGKGGGHGGMGIPRAPAPFKQPKLNIKTGGAADDDKHKGHVQIVAAGGEYLVPREKVLALGNGDIKHGHRILDSFVLHIRKKTAKTLNKLPGPKK